ncbi:hypothetical protein O3M35_000957 [Rhynocoris fuscipes]|uniref:Uncharacterized protein n=1 Tax=Rhynocoris fuscipes TaxID=488301 RepID=A0AAW1DRS3_9HEMI
MEEEEEEDIIDWCYGIVLQWALKFYREGLKISLKAIEERQADLHFYGCLEEINLYFFKINRCEQLWNAHFHQSMKIRSTLWCSGYSSGLLTMRSIVRILVDANNFASNIYGKSIGLARANDISIGIIRQRMDELVLAYLIMPNEFEDG